ncbi:MAG: hypothetical protein P0S93_04160 [Candidatus Neptunochlamydia sp.]|nr:hypothetical protein [Candidatus Neptunochlamydia sp.]
MIFCSTKFYSYATLPKSVQIGNYEINTTNSGIAGTLNQAQKALSSVVNQKTIDLKNRKWYISSNSTSLTSAVIDGSGRLATFLEIDRYTNECE